VYTVTDNLYISSGPYKPRTGRTGQRMNHARLECSLLAGMGNAL